MATETTRIMRPFASWFASIYFVAVALYSFIFVFLYDQYCLPLYVQGCLALASATGVFMMKRWSLWFSAISVPVIFAVELSTLNFSTTVSGFNPNLSTLTVNTSYLLIVVLAAFAGLLLVDKRREFK